MRNTSVTKVSEIPYLSRRETEDLTEPERDLTCPEAPFARMMEYVQYK